MSRENTKNPILELLEMILEGEGHKEMTEEMTPPTETKGFKSLVTSEEYEAIVGLKEAMDKYINVHNNSVVERGLKRDKDIENSYAMIQYILLSDMVEEAMQSIGAMYGIHIFDKDMIDELAKDNNTTVKDLEKEMMFDKLTRKLKG